MGLSQTITDQIEQKDLKRQNEHLEEFASIVSHDLQNLPAVAEGNLEPAQDICESDHLARAADAIGRGQELIENCDRNAVEHGGDDVSVAVETMDDGFQVADTGPGIPESDREEVFEAGSSTNEDGIGFGLRIAEHIADVHGWGITVTESKQVGVRFEITGVEFTDP